MPDANKIAPEPATAESITIEQLKWMRDNTGWIGPACEHAHQVIRAAMHGNPDARATCATWLNQRRVNDAFWAALITLIPTTATPRLHNNLRDGLHRAAAANEPVEFS